MLDGGLAYPLGLLGSLTRIKQAERIGSYAFADTSTIRIDSRSIPIATWFCAFARMFSARAHALSAESKVIITTLSLCSRSSVHVPATKPGDELTPGKIIRVRPSRCSDSRERSIRKVARVAWVGAFTSTCCPAWVAEATANQSSE